jgi:hypothetical protein
MNDQMSARLLPKQALPQLTRPRTKTALPNGELVGGE